MSRPAVMITYTKQSVLCKIDRYNIRFKPYSSDVEFGAMKYLVRLVAVADNLPGVLSPDQPREDLIAFLRALTDEVVLHDPRFSNPWKTASPVH
jgi:hypothetical protein